VTIDIRPKPLNKYDVTFVGRGGRVLKRVPVVPPR
jgi:hypothetical protein